MTQLNAPHHRPVPPSPAYHIKKTRTRSAQPQPWLLISLVLAVLALAPQELWPRLLPALFTQPSQPDAIQPDAIQTQALQPWSFSQASHTNSAQTCQTVVNADQRLSRSQLTQFLATPQTSSQAHVHETIAPPYCTLSTANQGQQSEAYPLAFDPATWFVINYEQGVYKSYDFVFRP